MTSEEKKHSLMTTFLLHLHPKMVNEKSLKFSRTFGLGGTNALLFMVLVLTGILLRFSYIPSIHEAYHSIISLQSNSTFGSLLRNLHHWSAQLLLITSFLHLLRVFYSQSIYNKRMKTWFYGLALFSLVLAFNFTGYLLPWDQLSYWAVTIMTNLIEFVPIIGAYLAHFLRSGDVVNESTLLNFYNLHTSIFPLLFVLFMALHFWLIRKAKGIAIPVEKEVKMLKVYPHLVYRELVMALVILVFLVLLSIFKDAPLLEMANPLVSPNPSKAPWYFVGYQELLIHLHPIFASLILPLLLITFMIGISYIKLDNKDEGSWFNHLQARKITIYSAIFSIILTAVIIISVEKWIDIASIDNVAFWIKTEVFPFMFFIIPIAIFLWFFIKIKKQSKRELVFYIFTIIISSYFVLSIFGYFFRGDYMQLIF